MIIIFNLTGFLVGIIGIFLGVLGLATTGLFSVSVALISIAWIAGGLLWRLKGPPRPDGRKAAWPSIFFIPMPIWGALLLFFGSGLGIMIDIAARNYVPDPRHQRFVLDTGPLRHQATSGDPAAANAVRDAIFSKRYAGAFPQDASVYVDSSPDSVLAVIRIPNLKQFSDAARVEALDAAEAALNAIPTLASKKKYIGIKGSLIFGAVRTPTFSRASAAESEQNLLDFYGPPPPKPGPGGKPGR